MKGSVRGLALCWTMSIVPLPITHEVFRAIYIRHHSGDDDLLEVHAAYSSEIVGFFVSEDPLVTAPKTEPIITSLFNFYTEQEITQNEFVVRYMYLHGYRKWNPFQRCGSREIHRDDARKIFVKLINYSLIGNQ